jgi:hypothetical protein
MLSGLDGREIFHRTLGGERFLMLRAVSGELPQWIIALDFLDEVRALGR